MTENNTTNTTRYPYLDADGRLTEEAQRTLEMPFAIEDLKFLPTDVNRDKKEATALVYADNRVYYQRLDEVFGAGNWSPSFEIQCVPYHKDIPEKRDFKTKEIKSPASTKDGHKLVVTATLCISGLAPKSSTGDCVTDDENAATSAEAQAFKRSCSTLGIGRYLYQFPKSKYGYDFGRWTQDINVPDWAAPPPRCADTGKPIFPYTFQDKDGNKVTWSTEVIVKRSMSKYKVPLSFLALQARIEKERATGSTTKGSKKESKNESEQVQEAA